jgi:hypothetical protein
MTPQQQQVGREEMRRTRGGVRGRSPKEEEAAEAAVAVEAAAGAEVEEEEEGS